MNTMKASPPKPPKKNFYKLAPFQQQSCHSQSENKTHYVVWTVVIDNIFIGPFFIDGRFNAKEFERKN